MEKLENRKISLLAKLLKVFSLYIGVCSGLLCMVLRLDIVFSERAFLLILFLFAFALWGIFSFLDEIPYGRSMVFGAMGVLGIIFFLRFRNIIIKGIAVIINSFLKLLMSYYNMKMELLSYPQDMQMYSNRYCTTIVLCLLGIILLAVVSMSFYRKKRLGIYIGCTLPFVLLPVFVGRFGFYKEMLFYVMSLAVLLGFSMNKEDDSESGLVQAKVTGLIVAGVLLAAGITFFICSPKKYEHKYESLLKIKQEISSLSEWSGDELLGWFKSMFSSDALDYGKVGNKERIDYTGKKILTIRPSKVEEGSIYLKSFVGDIYENNEWHLQNKPKLIREKQRVENQVGTQIEKWGTTVTRELSASRNDEEIQQKGLGNISVQTMRIRNIAMGRENKVVPYYIKENYEYNDAGKIVLDTGSQYNLSYYYGIKERYRELILEGDELPVYNSEYSSASRMNQLSRRLYEVAQSYYGVLPDGMDEILFDFREWCKRKEISKTSSVEEIIQAVARYLILDSGLQYTLAPGKTPEGMDSIDYFLNKNKKGYCIQFASSAVMMLRYLGVPARYAEGVYVSPDKVTEFAEEDKGSIEILDRDAHAWVEVYVRGFGFVPFDFTPGTTDSAELVSMEFSSEHSQKTQNEDNSQSNQTEQNMPNGQTEVPVDEDDVSDESSEQVEEEEMEFEDIESNKEDVQEEVNATQSGGESSSFVFGIIKGLLILIALVVLMYIQYIIRNRRYHDKLRIQTPKGTVKMLYRHILPLLRSAECEYCGGSQSEYICRITERIQTEPEKIEAFVSVLLKAEYARELGPGELSAFKKSCGTIHRLLWSELVWYRKLYMRYIFNI